MSTPPMLAIAHATKRLLVSGVDGYFKVEPTVVIVQDDEKQCTLMCRVDRTAHCVDILSVDGFLASTIKVSLLVPHGSSCSLTKHIKVLAGVDVEFPYMMDGAASPPIAFDGDALVKDGRWSIAEHVSCYTYEQILACAETFRVAYCPASHTTVSLPTSSQIRDGKTLDKWMWHTQLGNLKNCELRIRSRPYLTRPRELCRGQLFSHSTDDVFWATTESNIGNFVSGADAHRLPAAFKTFAMSVERKFASVVFDGAPQEWRSVDTLELVSSRLCANLQVTFVAKFDKATLDFFMSILAIPTIAGNGRTISWYKDHLLALGVKAGPRVSKLAEFAEMWAGLVELPVHNWFPSANSMIASVKVYEMRTHIFSAPDNILQIREKRGVLINTFLADQKCRTLYGGHLSRPLQLMTLGGDTFELLPWADSAQETWPAKLMHAYPDSFKTANFKVFNRHASSPTAAFSMCDILLEQDPPEGYIVFDDDDDDDDDDEQPEKRPRLADV